MNEAVAIHIVTVLNELFAIDPNVAKLFQNYVVTNDAMTEHPRAVVTFQGGSTWAIGVLGLLNALTEGEYRVARKVDEATGETIGLVCVRPEPVPGTNDVRYVPVEVEP